MGIVEFVDTLLTVSGSLLIALAAAFILACVFLEYFDESKGRKL